MKLSVYAKELGVCYKTAWNYFKAGRIPGAYRTETGTVIVPSNSVLDKGLTATYSRVSSSENKTNLLSQSKRVQAFCEAKGWVVDIVVEECGSGLNDERKKLMSLLTNPKVQKIVVEHKDRLTRFQFNLIKTFFNSYDVELECIENNNISDVEEFANDVMTLMASFSGKLYGRRSAKRKKELKEQKLKEKNEQQLV